MPSVMIRRERLFDNAAVHRIHDAGFGVVRGLPSGAPTAESAVLELLRADPDAWLPRLSLVAEVDGVVAGHVVCSRAMLNQRTPVLGLGPIAVRPGQQRRGIGTSLVHAVCAAAEALDEPLVVLLGDPAFYSRCGFVAAADHGVLPPVAEWQPFFQLRPLAGFDPAVHRGAFSYPRAFAAVS